MSFNFSMPGSFPGESSASRDHNATSTVSLRPIITELPPSTLFEQKEMVGTKTHAQKHLVNQLKSLSYFLIGFQFVRYCYSSCLAPLLLHLVVQKAIDVEDITDPSRPPRVLFGEAILLMEREAEAQNTTFRRSAWVSLLLAKLTLFIYWKYVVVCVWHLFFVVLLMQKLAANGNLDDVSLGLWYCLLFMGESVPLNLSASDSWVVQLWKLGLVELFVTNTAILALQILLFQSIYLQLTISPKGVALNEEEVYILRSQSGGARGLVPVDDEGRPDILYIRLFQMFERLSFSE